MIALTVGVIFGLMMLQSPANARVTDSMWSPGAGQLYSTQDLEEMHDNTKRIIISIEEEDGDIWIYQADSSTHNKYRSMN